jgi:hypothetical protein
MLNHQLVWLYPRNYSERNLFYAENYRIYPDLS